MLIIAHRGNLSGSNPKSENEPIYLEKASWSGFAVESDLWWHNDKMWLGHDEPTYPVEMDWLTQPWLWCHAKNIAALHKMLDYGKIKCFFHDKDEVTLTSNKIIWNHQRTECLPGSVCVCPEIGDITPPSHCYGICTDYPFKYEKMFNI